MPEPKQTPKQKALNEVMDALTLQARRQGYVALDCPEHIRKQLSKKTEWYLRTVILKQAQTY